MGLLGFVGKVAVGALKVGVGVCVALLEAACGTAKEANDIRHNSATRNISTEN